MISVSSSYILFAYSKYFCCSYSNSAVCIYFSSFILLWALFKSSSFCFIEIINYLLFLLKVSFNYLIILLSYTLSCCFLISEHLISSCTIGWTCCFLFCRSFLLLSINCWFSSICISSYLIFICSFWFSIWFLVFSLSSLSSHSPIFVFSCFIT